MNDMSLTDRRTISLHDFFRNPERTDYQISGDGRYISWLEPYERRMNIVVMERATGEKRRVTEVTDRDINAHFWKGDRILFHRDFDGDENFHLFSVAPDGSGASDLTAFENVRAMVLDEREEEQDNIYVAMNRRDPRFFDVWRLNVVTGELTLLAENPGMVEEWGIDHNGQVRVAVQTDGVNQAVLYRENDREEFRPLFTTNFRESFNLLFFDFDNRNFYALSNIGRDRKAVVLYDPVENREVEVVYEHPEVDAWSLVWSRKRHVLLAAVAVTWKTELHFLDDTMAEIYSRLQSRLPEMEITLPSYTSDESLYIVRASSDRQRGSYYLYDVGSDTLEPLGQSAPWLRPEELAEMKPISYTSRDGLTIHGYLTLPPDADPHNLPVVVNPHGGPWWRDMWGYVPEVQFLANRGYAVLQMNFRGSIGYGRRFWEASFKQWGLAMQDDISDGVAWLVEQGIADPKRVAIYGGSYGGYAVLAGLTFTPDLFACGVDFVGVSNLLTFMSTLPPYWESGRAMIYEQVGNPEHEEEMLRAASPVFHAERITAPLFVAQGAQDPRVNINESNQIVEALRSRGVEVEYMVKENEGHGFHNEENKFEFYEAMERFLARHIGDDRQEG